MTNGSQRAYKKIMTLRIITGIIWVIGIIIYIIRANTSDNFLQNPVMMILPAAVMIGMGTYVADHKCPKCKKKFFGNFIRFFYAKTCNNCSYDGTSS